MELDGPTEAQAIAELAIASATPYALADGVFSIVTPLGSRGRILDLERYEPLPRRPRGVATLYTGGSLVQYVQSREAHTASLYADVQTRRIEAVLNDHAPEGPGWADHRAVVALRHTPAWAAWTAFDGQIRDQVAFAEHIEDNLPDIAEPAGADMLEMAQTFEANTLVAFRSAHRLDNGQVQLRYEERTDATAGSKGQIPIPQTFLLGIAPFEGSDPYRVTARLRYRIRDGRLAIGYILDRPDDVLRAAFDEILSEVEEGTGLVAFRGSPPPPTLSLLPDYAS
jgi:uncharacterized protein YfdQ (DUF2303 family)